jgi:hypothetical protein
MTETKLEEYVSANGYAYVKWEGKWRLKHHYVIFLQRGTWPTKDERVSFKDKDRSNLDPSNIVCTPKKGGQRKRFEDLNTRIQVLVEERNELAQKLGEPPLRISR